MNKFYNINRFYLAYLIIGTVIHEVLCLHHELLSFDFVTGAMLITTEEYVELMIKQ